MGQPHHALRGPCGQAPKPKKGGGVAGQPNPNPRAAGLGAKPPLAAGPRRGWGAPPLCPLYKEGQGRGCGTHWLHPKVP